MVEALKGEGVLVFGTARDNERNNNVYGPFIFNERKDGVTQTIVVRTQRTENGQKRTLLRRHMRISGRGCALEISAIADKEGIVAVGRRNGGQAGTGITVVY